MSQCPECQTVLVVDGLPSGVQVRCARCFSQYRLGARQRTSADRLAWRSFWLGLASMILLFLTGLPAIYFGVRSLLRMRFVKHEKRDRLVAMIGTGLGVVFGLFVSFAVVAMGAVIGIALWTVEKTEQPDEVLAAFQQSFDNDLPGGVLPARAAQVLNSQRFFDFYDAEKPVESTLRIHLIHHTSMFQAPRSQVVNHLKKRMLNDQYTYTPYDESILKWELDGVPIDVKKIRWQIHIPGSETSPSEVTDDSRPELVTQYFGIRESADGTVGFCINLKESNDAFDELSIQQFVASLQPKK